MTLFVLVIRTTSLSQAEVDNVRVTNLTMTFYISATTGSMRRMMRKRRSSGAGRHLPDAWRKHSSGHVDHFEHKGEAETSLGLR